MAEGVRVLRSRSVAAPAMPAPSVYTESLGTGVWRNHTVPASCLWAACATPLRVHDNFP